MINKERILKEFMELVKIDSPSKEEREVAEVLKARLSQLGLEIKEDAAGKKIGGNCGNIIAFLPKNAEGAPVIMFNTHMDCVQPCSGVEPVLKDGIIASKGNTILGSDNKAGIAGIMEALRIIVERNLPHGDIKVVFTIAEEAGLQGAKNINIEDIKADFGYALDCGGSPGEIINIAPGQNNINVVIHGKAAHAGAAPEEGINAIVAASKALAEMELGRIDFETTSNVGIINGGVATNIVPDRVELRCEVRSRDSEKLEKQTRYIEQAFIKAAERYGARAEVNVAKSYDSYILSEDAPVMKLFKKAAGSIGLSINVVGTGGGSDANFFNAYKVPTAVLGIGMSKVHTVDEYIKEIDLYNVAGLVLAIIQAAVPKQEGKELK